MKLPRKRKLTEEEINKILEERDRLKKYFDISGVMFVSINKNLEVTHINKKGCEILGYDEKDILGKNWFENFIPGNIRNKVKTVFQKIISGVLEPVEYFENTVLTKSGKQRVIFWHNALLRDQNGNIEGTLSSGEDITDRKLAEEEKNQSEEAYATLFNSSGDGILIAELESLKLVEANPSICKMLGFSREELLSKTVKDIHPPEAFESVVEEFRAQAAGEKLLAQNIPCLTKQGKTVYADISTTKAMFMGRECNIGFFRDITERLQVEKQLQQSQKMEAIGTLAGGIAHDFNNILSIIMGNISLALSMINRNNKVYDILSNVMQGANQARDLTQQLLTFAKGGSPIKKPHSINKILEESLQFVLSGSKSKFNLKLESNLWSSVVDSGQIKQVFSNIIINADQAMPKGGIITITTKNTNVENGKLAPLEKGPYVKISIEDQGIGIQPKHISHIFDPFFSIKDKGCGLGLAIAYSIVKKHNGHIAVNSKVGKGTIFEIYLPASLEIIEKTTNQETVDHQGHGKILIMDDQELILDLAKAMLSSMGYKTITAGNGAEAIEIYREAFQSSEPFDMVIVDLTVPGGLGGVETIPELLKIDPQAKVVVSSGYSNDPIMANYKEYGFCGVITKPYTMAQLSELLNKIHCKADQCSEN